MTPRSLRLGSIGAAGGMTMVVWVATLLSDWTPWETKDAVSLIGVQALVLAWALCDIRIAFKTMRAQMRDHEELLAELTAKGEGRSSYRVVLIRAGEERVRTIRAVRRIGDLGLAEARLLVEHLPALLRRGLAQAEAEGLRQQLEAAGATARVEDTTTGPAAI